MSLRKNKSNQNYFYNLSNDLDFLKKKTTLHSHYYLLNSKFNNKFIIITRNMYVFCVCAIIRK